MRERLFYSISVIVLIVAFALHLLARETLNEGRRLKAKRIENTIMSKTSLAVTPAEASLSSSGRNYNRLGWVFTAIGTLCLIKAFHHRETGWFSVPIVVLVADIFVTFTL